MTAKSSQHCSKYVMLRISIPIVKKMHLADAAYHTCQTEGIWYGIQEYLQAFPPASAQWHMKWLDINGYPTQFCQCLYQHG